jgi:hypothetical protein
MRLMLWILLLAIALCVVGVWWYRTQIFNQNEGTKVTKDGARAIVEKKIRSDMAIVDNQTEEHDFGWVFFYTTKRYLETKNINDIVPGNGPIIVNRDGSVVTLPTSQNPKILIADYEKSYRITHSSQSTQQEHSAVIAKICGSKGKEYTITEYSNAQGKIGGYVTAPHPELVADGAAALYDVAGNLTASGTLFSSDEGREDFRLKMEALARDFPTRKDASCY